MTIAQAEGEPGMDQGGAVEKVGGGQTLDAFADTLDVEWKKRSAKRG